MIPRKGKRANGANLPAPQKRSPASNEIRGSLRIKPARPFRVAAVSNKFCDRGVMYNSDLIIQD